MSYSGLSQMEETLIGNFRFMRKINVLLDIVFPILFSFNDCGKQYLCYVTKFNRRKKQLNMLVSETTDEILLQVVTQEISIRSAMMAAKIREIDNENIYLKEINIDYLEKLLPEDDFFLDESIPNKVDLVKQRKIIKHMMFKTEYILKEMEQIHYNFNINVHEKRPSSLNYVKREMEQIQHNFKLNVHEKRPSQNYVKYEQAKKFLEIISNNRKSMYIRNFEE